MAVSLVAGGAGFIGSWLCEELLRLGHDVVCVDNLITGNKKNISECLKNKKFTFVEHDITKEIQLKQKFDFIFHLASPASPVVFSKYPMETIYANSLGTLNLLKIAKRDNARFLLASTSEVYGDPLEHPQKETYWGNVNPIGPRSCYDESKRFAETLTINFGVNFVIVRIFNTYGPKMDLNDGRVVPNFIKQALNGEPLTIYGSGKQTRSFCYVSDNVRALVKLALSDRNDVFNVGNSDEYTIAEFAQKVLKLTKSKSKIIYKNLPKDDPVKRKPDITKISKLGWKPKINLDTGLKLTISSFSK